MLLLVHQLAENEINSTIVSYNGKRLILFDEYCQYTQFDAAKMKKYSGGNSSVLQGRNPYDRGLTFFEAIFKMVCCGNHLPNFTGIIDQAYFMRIIHFVFRALFTSDIKEDLPLEGKFAKDVSFYQKSTTKAFLDQMMRWLIASAKIFYDNGKMENFLTNNPMFKTDTETLTNEASPVKLMFEAHGIRKLTDEEINGTMPKTAWLSSTHLSKLMRQTNLRILNKLLLNEKLVKKKSGVMRWSCVYEDKDRRAHYQVTGD